MAGTGQFGNGVPVRGNGADAPLAAAVQVDTDNDAPAPALLATIVILTLVMNTLARGVTETFAVFLLPVQDGLGVTRSQITAAYSIYMLVLGFSAPFAGQLIDRAGARISYGIGLLALGGGYVAAGSVSSIYEYYLCVGLLGGLGGTAIGMVVASSLLSRWFAERIGLVMAVPYCAVGLGMLVLPWITQVLLQSLDWRTVYRILGLGVLGFLPFIMLLPLGRITRGSSAWRRQRSQAASAVGGWTLMRSIRSDGFWGLFAAYFVTAVAAYSVLPQSVAYLSEMGFDPLVAAGAFGFTGALSVVGILSIGWLSDAIGRKPAVSFSYLMSIAGTSMLILIAVWPSLILLYGFVLCFGLMQGARGPVILSYVVTLFPGGNVGAIYGTLSLALGLGAGIGSWTSGLLHELTGTYYASFAQGAFASLIGLVLFWSVRSLRRDSTAIERVDRTGGH